MPRLYVMQPGLPNTETLRKLACLTPDTPTKNSRDLPYRRFAGHYKACLDKQGDSHLGVDWPNTEDVDFLTEALTFRFVFRQDDGWYECIVYRYR